MSRIAITGATGSLGRHVLCELLARSLEVVAVVRDPRNLGVESSKLEVIPFDLSTPACDFYEQMGCPDALIHMAWTGLPNYQATFHFETELPLQFQFLRSLVESGLPHLVVPGTCLEYGMRSGELSERQVPDPSTPYGFAKDSLRRQLVFLQTGLNFTLAWPRLFYLYGEGQKPSALFSLLKSATDRGETEFPMSGGEQLRDFLPVGDVAYYLVELALLHQNTGPINLSSGIPRSVRGAVERWLEDNHKNIQLKLGEYPYPSYEPMAFWGANAKLRQLLGERMR